VSAGGRFAGLKREKREQWLDSDDKEEGEGKSATDLFLWLWCRWLNSVRQVNGDLPHPVVPMPSA
jgi:hypothetical protein